jgi:spermidine synthase
MDHPASAPPEAATTTPAVLAGVACVSSSLLMTELALTRIFSVTMYYHFAFLAISIALFGLSASGVYVFLARRRFAPLPARTLLAWHALVYAAVTTIALASLVRIRVGLNYSPRNLALMLAIYALAALPFLAGGSVITLAVSRLAGRINLVYAVDLVGASVGCVLLLPLLDRIGAPGVVLATASLAAVAALCFAPAARRRRIAVLAGLAAVLPWAAHLGGVVSFDVGETKGHEGDRVLFSKWNSFSRVAVYDRKHGEWSLSPAYTGPMPDSRFMDIDSAASTPIVKFSGRLDDASYLRSELTSIGYHLIGATGVAANGGAAGHGLSALVIGPGGGRDLLAALAFGATRVDGVEINAIIARDVMLDRFREYSGDIYRRPGVRVFVEDGRSFVRRSPDRYDVIQASLVDTWAATAAGAYTLTENSLYTVEAFEDYLDHLTEGGLLTITRWAVDGLRLVSLAQEACARRGWTAHDRIAVVQHEKVATFILKRSPFTPDEVRHLDEVARALRFTILYAPGLPAPATLAPTGAGHWEAAAGAPNDYARLIAAPDRWAFYAAYSTDVTPTTDDRPFFFHTTKPKDQLGVAFGRSMLFGNGLSALITLIGISGALVLLFVLGPLALGGRSLLGTGWPRWLGYFGLLGAAFMLVEVALLQRFVLLLGHPVYSLAVTLFSLLLGTGIGSFLSRRLPDAGLPRSLRLALAGLALLGLVAVVALPPLIRAAIVLPLGARLALAAAVLLPAGMLMGVPLPAGVRLLSARRPELLPWAWAMNGALSVLGATLAVFIAMNWGFSVTLLAGGTLYLLAAGIVLAPGAPASRL